MAIYLADNAFSVKAKSFNKMFTSVLALFFLLVNGFVIAKKKKVSYTV